MVVNKFTKSVFHSETEKVDKIREMMIASANYSSDFDFSTISEFIVTPNSPRKRRLDHLSQEEKIRRKKLKNREAAQTSRDRKKAYVTSLEESLELLQNENSTLLEKVKSLESENATLKGKNKSLEEQRLKHSPVLSNEPGSAVPLTPLPQGRLLSTQVMSRLLSLQLAVILSLTSVISIGCVISQTLTSRNLTDLQNLYLIRLWKTRKNFRKRMWWGPTQRAWNPVKMTA